MSRAIDITNQRFNSLVALEKVGQIKRGFLWKCKCDCGNEITVPTSNLRYGNNKSCGCLKHQKAHTRLKLVGQKFSRLTVLEDIGTNSHGESLWKCNCDCGQTIITTGNSLTGGNTKSCGCYQRDMSSKASQLPKGEAAFNAAYSGYQRTAIQKGNSFELSKKEFRSLIIRDCFYCGDPPSEYKDGSGRNGRFKRNGLDRMDNDKGYILDNVVACCKTCNVMKKAMDVGKFLCHINEIARRHSLT